MDEEKVLSNVINKRYKHFDRNLSPKNAKRFFDSVVTNKDKIASYRFHPLILKYKESKIYHRAKHQFKGYVKSKKRPISLVAHHDELVYSYYANELSTKYEDYINNLGLFKVPTAYRKLLKGSNITAAKEVFDEVITLKDCWIIKGDFKSFFNNIRHKKLATALCKVLKVNALPSDWKRVFKSITAYRYVNESEISPALKKLGLNRNQAPYYTRSHRELGNLIHSGQLKVNGPNSVGIPQGTAISAVLANVYMIEFDKQINQLVAKNKGMYRRYSDDFVIVIPKLADQKEVDIHDFINLVKSICTTETKLTIETNKTKVFNYDAVDGTKRLFNNEFHQAWFDYLGFLFNGKVVTMRPKSVYKFHYKSKKMLRHIRRLQVDKYKFDNHKSFYWNINYRMVWDQNERVIRSKSDFHKQLTSEHINQNKQKLAHCIPQKKIATKMYLTHKRYGEKYSMAGYAKRAQRIMIRNNNQYQVKIWQPISDQITKNQNYRKDNF